MIALRKLRASLEEVIEECEDRHLVPHATVDRLRAAALVLPVIQSAHEADVAKKKKEQEQE